MDLRVLSKCGYGAFFCWRTTIIPSAQGSFSGSLLLSARRIEVVVLQSFVRQKSRCETEIVALPFVRLIGGASLEMPDSDTIHLADQHVAWASKG